TGNDAFVVREWLAADGDARLPGDARLAENFSCDPSACIARLADGSLVSVVLTPDAFLEECARAKLVLTPRTAPPFCPATAVDRTTRRATGALALTRTDTAFAMTAGRPATQDRPWARRWGGEGSAGERPATGGTLAPTPPNARDATPRAEDLGPDD